MNLLGAWRRDDRLETRDPELARKAHSTWGGTLRADSQRMRRQVQGKAHVGGYTTGRQSEEEEEVVEATGGIPDQRCSAANVSILHLALLRKPRDVVQARPLACVLL